MGKNVPINSRVIRVQKYVMLMQMSVDTLEGAILYDFGSRNSSEIEDIS
jgi:hypothetical protein